MGADLCMENQFGCVEKRMQRVFDRIQSVWRVGTWKHSGEEAGGSDQLVEDGERTQCRV